jgi:oligo-1,6-glucosidase
MKNCPQDWSIDEEYKDVGTVNCWTEIKQAAEEENKPELLKLGEEGIRLTARDHARTPMQWDSSPQAGFSSNPNTWMRVMDSYTEINAASQVRFLCRFFFR